MLSASADGTVQVWNIFPALLQPLSSQTPSKRDSRVLSASRVFRPSNNSVPTSVLFLPNDETACAVGLTSGDVCVLNIDTGRQIHFFDAAVTKTGELFVGICLLGINHPVSTNGAVVKISKSPCMSSILIRLAANSNQYLLTALQL